MKTRHLLISLGLLLSISIKANDRGITAMLFPQFESGYAINKDGSKVNTKFNYDQVEERILFVDIDGQVLRLHGNTVNFVAIGDRFFFPMNNDIFYERIFAGSSEYFVKHKVKRLSKGRSVGYGMYSTTAAITDGGLLAVSGASQGSGFTPGLQDFFADEKFEGVDDSSVFVRNRGRLVRINSLRTLVKLFRNHKTEIESFASENNIDFRCVEGVQEIVAYALSL